MIYPYYPLYVAVIISVALAALALEVPAPALMVGILLTSLAAMYQNAYAGIVMLIVLALAVSLSAGSWTALAFVEASWILSFLMPALAILAIIPIILAGLYYDKQTVIKTALLSSVTIFLIAWSRGISAAGLILAPFPAPYVGKPIPVPWMLNEFLPGADFLDTPKLAAYFGSIGQTIGDVRVYVMIALWVASGYIVSLLIKRWRGFQGFAGAPLLGVLPIIIASFVFAQSTVYQLALVVVGAVVAGVAYKIVLPLVAGPSMDVFRRFQDLIPEGFPKKYTVLLGSPVCEERNLIIDQFMNLGKGQSIAGVLLTSDIDFGRNMASQWGDKLTVLLANPRSTVIKESNIIPVSTGVQNLTALNIELVRVVKNYAGVGSRICIDVLTDVLLNQKLLTTRKWVTDLLPRLQEWDFTVLGAFNPSLHSKEDVEGLTDIFNGYLEVSDKELEGTTRKVIIARKMLQLKYADKELLLRKESIEQPPK